MSNTNNLVSTAKVYPENKYVEFTTLFRIPFNDVDPAVTFTGRSDRWEMVLSAWSEVCILALETRMDSCVSMLFRNRNNIVVSNENQIIFKKSNGEFHVFNHSSFKAMEDMVKYFKDGIGFKPEQAGVRQLLKALYWIPEELKQNRGYSFSQLISCLEEFTFDLH